MFFNIKEDYESKRFINTKKIGDKIFNNREKYILFLLFKALSSKEEIDKNIMQNKNIILDYILLPKTQYWERVCNVKILTNLLILKERKERVL